ncbi:hypothetical protein [Micromonospora sp. NPDC007220]|uniref:hypothetical protein n=1 Tax=Micromonospora sp. NPDC007220 TaxID=3154318 RepID=UPI003410B5EE
MGIPSPSRSGPLLAVSDVIALVDVFNVDPGVRTDRDYEELVDLVGQLLQVSLRAPRRDGIVDVDCRLYGGFTDRIGNPTEQFNRLRKQLRRLQGLREGMRVRPSIARSLACQPSAILVGTYKNGGQKMVDQMLAQDALHFARIGGHDTVVVVADDDDYLPAMLTLATQTRTPLRWLRRRSTTANDPHFSNLSVTFLVDGSWR